MSSGQGKFGRSRGSRQMTFDGCSGKGVENASLATAALAAQLMGR